MILPRQRTIVILVGLLLSIVATPLLQFVNQHEGAIAAEATDLRAQERLSVRNRERYTTRLFDLSGRELTQFAGRLDRFSPDGRRLLTESSVGLGNFYLFDVSGNRLLQFQANTVQFSPDARHFIVRQGSIVSQSTIAVYDASGHKLTEVPRVFNSTPIFSPNGGRLIILADDSAYLLDASGQQLAQIQGRYVDSGSGFDPTGERFILSFLGNPETDSPRCDLFSSSGEAIVQLPGACAGMSPDGQRFLLLAGKTFDDLFLQIHDFSGREIAQLSAAMPTLSSDGHFILTNDLFSRDSSYLYRSSGEEIAQLQGAGGRFSTNNQRLITVLGNRVHLYDLSGRRIAEVPGHRAIFLPGSDRFITYLFGRNEHPLNIAGGETRLFDAAGREIALLQGNPPLGDILFEAGELSQVSEFAGWSSTFISSDGQRLVTINAESSYLYNASGEQIAQLPGVFTAFSSTGQHLITRSGGKFYLFDRSGKKLMEVEGEYGGFSPDGQHVATTSENTLP